mgnify:CR=1 FL=1
MVLHVPSQMYQDWMQSRGRQEARRMIKPVTTHNDKLGFDWSVPGGKYKLSDTKHYEASTYVGFIKKAIARWAEHPYAKHLTDQLANFNMPLATLQQKTRNQRGPIADIKAEAKMADREVGGINQEMAMELRKKVDDL